MADTKISAMPTAATLDGTELVPLVQAGDNVQQTIENTIVQTFQATPNIGLNTTNVNSYGTGWTTFTVGGVNTNNAQPSGGEIDLVSVNGTSHVELFYDTEDFFINNTGTGSILLSAPTNITLSSPVKTSTLTGYLYGNGSSSNVTASITIPSSALDIKYGSFFDTTTQTNGGATSANVMTFNTADLTNGVSIVTDSQITLATAGVYNIQFSSQFSRAGGIGFSTVDVWLSKNGANVTSSNTQVNVPNSGGKAVASWTFLVDASAGDYYELYWSSTDTSVVMFHIDSEINPTRPSIPSVILNVIQVS